MLNTLIVGASGYAGAELVTYINRHPHMNITALTVSAQSNDAENYLTCIRSSKALSICRCSRCPISANSALAWTWCFSPPRTK